MYYVIVKRGYPDGEQVAQLDTPEWAPVEALLRLYGAPDEEIEGLREGHEENAYMGVEVEECPPKYEMLIVIEGQAGPADQTPARREGEF